MRFKEYLTEFAYERLKGAYPHPVGKTKVVIEFSKDTTIDFFPYWLRTFAKGIPYKKWGRMPGGYTKFWIQFKSAAQAKDFLVLAKSLV